MATLPPTLPTPYLDSIYEAVETVTAPARHVVTQAMFRPDGRIRSLAAMRIAPDRMLLLLFVGALVVEGVLLYQDGETLWLSVGCDVTVVIDDLVVDPAVFRAKAQFHREHVVDALQIDLETTLDNVVDPRCWQRRQPLMTTSGNGGAAAVRSAVLGSDAGTTAEEPSPEHDEGVASILRTSDGLERCVSALQLLPGPFLLARTVFGYVLTPPGRWQTIRSTQLGQKRVFEAEGGRCFAVETLSASPRVFFGSDFATVHDVPDDIAERAIKCWCVGRLVFQPTVSAWRRLRAGCCSAT